MGNIPIEIAFDILCRSPAKSLARFTTVSKAWASLLSDPNFAELHCHQQLQNLKLISNLKLIARHGRLYSLDLDSLDCALRIDFLLKDSDFTINKILGLSDHLLCLSVSSKSNPDPNPDLKYIDFDDGIIVICNLSTGARHIVPPSPIEFPHYQVALYYQDNPYYLQKRFSYGFGFDPSGDDYKLVRIYRCECTSTSYYIRDGTYLSQSKVYSMKTKSWSVIDQDISQFRLALKEPVVLDGVVYWVAGGSCITISYERHDLIVAFDLARGSFRRVPMPHFAWKHCLLSLGGKLCVMCDMRVLEAKGLRFYKMEEDGHSVSWTPFASFGCTKFCYDQALTFSKNGDKVLVKQREDEFICFDLAEETISTGGVHFFSMKEEKRKRVE